MGGNGRGQSLLVLLGPIDGGKGCGKDCQRRAMVRVRMDARQHWPIGRQRKGQCEKDDGRAKRRSGQSAPKARQCCCCWVWERKGKMHLNWMGKKGQKILP